MTTPQPTRLPRRDDEVAVWIKRHRDQFSGPGSIGWQALDDVLDDYRLHADTGARLSEEVSDGGYGDSGNVADGVGTATPADPDAFMDEDGIALTAIARAVGVSSDCSGFEIARAVQRFAASCTPGEPRPTVDEMEAHFLDANERMGEALVAIGMALGLPRPRTGATWGAPEILAKIVSGPAAAPPLRGDSATTGFVINRYGSPVPPPEVDLTACPLTTCTRERRPPCDSCGEPWGHCADDCQDPTESHDEAGLRAEVYRLRAVYAWLDGHDKFKTARKAKALGRQYGVASRTIAELRGKLARAQIAAAPARPGVARPEPGSLAPCGKCRWTQPYIAITHGCPEHDDHDGESW